MNELYVVETEDNLFIGLIDFVNAGVVVRSGFAGHPRFVATEDIVQLMPAHMHADVEIVSSDYMKAV